MRWDLGPMHEAETKLLSFTVEGNEWSFMLTVPLYTVFVCSNCGCIQAYDYKADILQFVTE